MDLSSSSATLTSMKSIISLMAFCFPTRPKGPPRTSESSLLHMTFKPLYHLSLASFVNLIMTTFSASATLNSSKTKFSLSLSWEHASTLTTWQTSIHPSTLTSNLVFFDISRWVYDSCLWGPTLPGHICFTLTYWSVAAFPTWTWASLFHGVYLHVYLLFFSSLRGKQQCNNCLEYKWRQKEKSLQNGFIFTAAAATATKSLQSCPTLCDPIDSSPPGSAVPGILQARTLEWVAISFSILLSTY